MPVLMNTLYLCFLSLLLASSTDLELDRLFLKQGIHFILSKTISCFIFLMMSHIIEKMNVYKRFIDWSLGCIIDFLSLNYSDFKSEEFNDENPMMEGITSSFIVTHLPLFCLTRPAPSSFNYKCTYTKTHRHTRMSLLNETRDSVCAH